MKILLVGGGGFIGGNLLRALHGAGHSIIATSRRARAPSWPGVEWLALDLGLLANDPGHFLFPDDVDLLINAAGLLSVDTQALSLVQDHGARALFDQAARRGVPVLQISALGASAQSDVPFLSSKGMADEYLSGLNNVSVVLRPSLVLGPGGASSGWLLGLSPWPVIPLLDLKARIQPVHIDDLAGSVLALLRHWPTESVVLPLVGPEPMTLAQLIDHLRAAQGWPPARYLKAPALLTQVGSRMGDRFGWRALNRQSVVLAQRDNLADPAVLASVCGYRAAPVQTRLNEWPTVAQSSLRAVRPLMFVVLALIWLGTAAVCLGPGYDWGLRIMAEAGVHGAWAKLAVISGALCDGILGVGMLLQRWRRQALRLQLALMLGYTLCISFVLPHYWFDPYAAVAKNLVLIVATLWLLWTEPRQ
jgi:uncharacterized protein YbjT (DUF2867 family)